MVAEPVASIFQPTVISSTTDETGIDSSLIITGADGTSLCLTLEGVQDPHRCQALKEELAYSIYEQRGCSDGSDMEDWLRAEKLISEREHELVPITVNLSATY